MIDRPQFAATKSEDEGGRTGRVEGTGRGFSHLGVRTQTMDRNQPQPNPIDEWAPRRTRLPIDPILLRLVTIGQRLAGSGFVRGMRDSDRY
jgi:hypothetical protein